MAAPDKPIGPTHLVFTHQGFGVKGRDSLIVECICSTRVLATCTGTAAEKRERAGRIEHAHLRR